MKNQDLRHSEYNSNSNIKVDKVKKVLNSIAQLFQPFKDVLINILPRSKSIVAVFDFFGRCIAKLVMLVAAFIPLFIKFLKGKIFKILLILIILLVVLNTVVSRVININSYKNILTTAIEDTVGYKTVIEGRISVNFLLLSINIYNAAFYSPTNKKSELDLNLLSVNNLKIKFSYLALLTGKLKAKQVTVNKAEVRYKFVSEQIGEDKFISLSNELNEVTNISMKSIDYNNKVSDSTRLIKDDNNFNISSSTRNKTNDNPIIDNKLQNDNYRKYLNLKGVFTQQDASEAPVFVNVDNNIIIYKIFAKLTQNLKFDLSSLNALNFSNVIFKLVDINNKTIIVVDNLSGNLNRSFLGKHALSGEGRILNKDMFFTFSSFNLKEGKQFELLMSYENNNFTSKDIIINGVLHNQNQLNGTLALSGNALKNLFIQSYIKNDFINIKDSYLTAQFTYKNAILNIDDSDLTLNKVKNNISVLYNFSGNGVIELGLNLSLNNLNDVFTLFSNYKKNKIGSNFSVFNELLLHWQTSRNNVLNPKFFAINLEVNNTKLNDTPLELFKLNGFLDNNDNFYINTLTLQGNDINAEAKGKIQLVNKTGTLLISSQGSISSLCNYSLCSNNLKQFLKTIGGFQDQYSFSTKAFLTEDRFIFNDINGNFGNKTINKTNATLLERNNMSDLIINSQLDNIDFKDLQDVYYFNKGVGRLYYNDNNNIIGIPDNLTVYLNLYSNELTFKGLNFINFQMESTIINSGILIHNFSFYDSIGEGIIKGSFNFNDKVSPSIIGNIIFNNVLLNAENLNFIAMNKYNIAGKIVLNGNINVSGDDYYNGLNKVNGNLSLIKYERLKINKDNKTPGFYLTLLKLLYEDKDYYQIGDLYGNINIINNLVILSPSVIRYIDGKDSYRGPLNGSWDILKDTINLQAILNSENNKPNIEKDIKGDLLNLHIQ